MSDKDRIELSDMSRRDGVPLTHVENADLMPLPAPLDDPARERAVDAADRPGAEPATSASSTTPAP